MGVTYYFLGNTKTAAELFLKTLQLNEENNDSLGISKALLNLVIIYRKKGQSDIAEQAKIWDGSHIYKTPGATIEKGTGFG